MLDSSEPVSPAAHVEGDLAQQRADERQQPDLDDQRPQRERRVQRGAHARGPRQLPRLEVHPLDPPGQADARHHQQQHAEQPDAGLARRREHGLHGGRGVPGQRELAHDRVGDRPVVLVREQRRGEDDERDQGRERLGRDDHGAVQPWMAKKHAQTTPGEPLLVHHVRQAHRASLRTVPPRAPHLARVRTHRHRAPGRRRSPGGWSHPAGVRRPGGCAAYQWSTRHREGGHPNDHHHRRAWADRLPPDGVPQRDAPTAPPPPRSRTSSRPERSACSTSSSPARRSTARSRSSTSTAWAASPRSCSSPGPAPA